MKRVLYDLAAADETVRFSPYCWRVKLALAHKSLSYTTVPWRFTDKAALAFSGQDKVPVLVDGAKVVADSQTIAEYLETAYPNEASLFGEPPSRALTKFIKAWTEDVLQRAIAPLVLPHLVTILAPQDQAYFRETRERVWGTTLEDLAARRAEFLPGLEAALRPLRTMLKAQSFLAGPAPAYADHLVYGAIKWGLTTSAEPLLPAGDAILTWMDGVLATYGL
jgi:glutathione S-transferase